jgi:hypothetical protein
MKYRNSPVCHIKKGRRGIFAAKKKIAKALRHSLGDSLLWIEDKMKKMKLSLASIILLDECYKRKCKNVSKVLNSVNFH